VLAYVFWHWRQSPSESEEYEARQRAFHAALAAEPPAGFHRSTTASLSGAPWAAGGGAAYEDWYLVDGMSSLEALNQAAVTGSRQRAHDSAAALAADGAAGLYALRAGRPVEVPTHAAWFGKPAGMKYAALFDELAPLLREAGAALWMRQMVLGPTPEFCLHGATPPALPPRYAALRLGLRPVWPAR
jgi:hypothetical protein